MNNTQLMQNINEISEKNLQDINIPTIEIPVAGRWSIETGIYYDYEKIQFMMFGTMLILK
jgi:hypothetical protein